MNVRFILLASLATPAIARGEHTALEYLGRVQESLPKIALILIVSFVFAQLLHFATRRLVRLSRTPEIASTVRAQQLRTLAGVLNSGGIFVVVIIAILEILPIFEVDIKPLLASAGIAGLAVGFGAQTLVKDVINGFFILVENQYNVGDVVRIAGVKGSVEAMTMRRTVLRDADGTLHVVPNSEVKIVSNLTRDWAQITLHVATAYDEKSDRVMQLLREVGAEVRNDPRFAELIVAEPEVPGIERVAGSEVDYLMLVKTLPGTAQHTVSRELRRRIKESFAKNDIKPAGPSRVYVMDRDLPGDDRSQ